MTLLIGRNNVGKTSAYAPFLLLKQTLQAKNPETALLLRGGLADFGTYRDIVTDHNLNRDIIFYLDFGSTDPTYFAEPEQSATGPIKWSSIRKYALEVTFSHDEINGVQLKKSIIYGVVNGERRLIETRLRQANGSFKVTSNLLPRNTSVGRPLKEVAELRSSLQGEEPHGYLFSGVSGLRIPAAWRRDRDRWAKVQVWYRAVSDLYDIHDALNTHIYQTMASIAYIGPLRSSPRRSYLVSAERPMDVGRDGEFAAEVLYQASRQLPSEVLNRANEWLARLGYGELDFLDSGGEYFQVLVGSPDTNLQINLADCGVGLSQLLPLLVQGCVMLEGDTLIAQQPEIHLNPAQQDVMTDFLIDLCRRGRRVIVETHSEHVLGRLRRRVAEEELSSEDVAVYYCESNRGRSSVRQISLGEYGEIASEWPQGFFNEQLDNSMEMSLAQARRKRAGKKEQERSDQ